jgi:hypothetical protein
VALAFAIGGSSFAQDGGQQGRGRGVGGGFGAFGGGMTIDKPTLLGSEQVRKELKVTEEQGKKLEEELTAHRTASRELFGGGQRDRDASDEERQKAREERAKKTAELSKKTEAKLVAILDKAQNARLDEIYLQQQGVDALVSDSVVASLKLSKEQVEKMKGALKTRDDELTKLRPAGRRGGGGAGGGERSDFQAIREKSEKLRKDTETSVLAMLTKEQSEAFTKMKGAAFELDRASLFPRGPGGRGQGGQGGQGGRGGQGGGGERKRPPADNEL